MDTNELFPMEQFRVVNNPGERQVNSLYCADLLSWTMTHAPRKSIWCTVIGNVNSVAVAVAAEISVIVLCEDVVFGEDALLKARQHEVFLVKTDLPVFEAAVRLAKKAGFLAC